MDVKKNIEWRKKVKQTKQWSSKDFLLFDSLYK